VTGTFALLIRSLRTDARMMRSHLLRLLFVGLIYVALLQAQEQSAWLGAPGLQFFWWIVWLNFGAITLAGASFFANVITEEKEEQTLGLLRMAGISPLSLLLGKSAPRLMTAVVLLSLQLPFTMLAITLGGVTMHQILAAYCSLLAYIVLLSSVGLFSSVVRATSRRASSLVVLFLLIFLILVPLARMIVGLAGPNLPVWVPDETGAVLAWGAEASPFFRLRSILQTGFNEPLFDYQVLSNLVLAAVGFGLAWALFDKFNRSEAPAGPERGLLFGRRSRLRRLGTMRAWSNPLLWKDFYFIAGGKGALIGKFVIYGLLVAGIIWLMDFGGAFTGSRPGEVREAVAVISMVMSLYLLGIELAVCAGRFLHEEVKWKTLSNLLMLPHSIPFLVYSKAAGCAITLAPAAFWFFFGAFVGPDMFADGVEEITRDEEGLAAFMFFAVQYLVFIHATALFSLFVGAGALPLALFVVFVLNMCCLSPFTWGPGVSDGTAFFVMMSMLGMCITAVLHVLIGVRLRAIGAH
jgi:ABC-type multidrug transport system permease subunit